MNGNVSWENLAKIAQGDQDQAARSDFARMLRTHYDGLLAVGFTEVQATYLTERYQAAMIAVATQLNRKDGDA